MEIKSEKELIEAGYKPENANRKWTLYKQHLKEIKSWEEAQKVILKKSEWIEDNKRLRKKIEELKEVENGT